MNDFAKAFATTNQIDTHYYHSVPDPGNRPTWLEQKQSGPALVLLHGITDGAVCWNRVARVLGQDYELVIPDMRGHGLSDAPEMGYGAEDRAADVVGLIEVLGLNRPVLVGDAFGAETAIVTAALYPERVKAVVLEDPPWPGRFWGSTLEERAERAEKWRADIEQNRLMTIDELISLARERYPEWAEEDLEPWAESKKQVSPFVSNIVLAPRRRWSDYLRRASCPILLITGEIERGAIVTHNTANEASFYCPAIQHTQIPDAGHFIHREQFRAYIQAVKEFLQKVDS